MAVLLSFVGAKKAAWVGPFLPRIRELLDSDSSVQADVTRLVLADLYSELKDYREAISLLKSVPLHLITLSSETTTPLSACNIPTTPDALSNRLSFYKAKQRQTRGRTSRRRPLSLDKVISQAQQMSSQSQPISDGAGPSNGGQSNGNQSNNNKSTQNNKNKNKNKKNKKNKKPRR